MTRGRPKHLCKMTEEERGDYWANRAREAQEMLTPAQKGAIDRAQLALVLFAAEWSEDFDLKSGTVRELNQAMKSLCGNFDLHHGTF